MRSFPPVIQIAGLQRLVEHYLIGFVFDEIVDFVGVVLRDIIDLLFTVLEVVFGNEFILLLLFELFVYFSSYVANADLGLLAHLFDLLDELFPSFFTKGGNAESDEFAVNDRSDTQVTALDGLFDLVD